MASSQSTKKRPSNKSGSQPGKKGISKGASSVEDGKEYPLIKLEISHTSHPFFTGKMKFVDTAGRVDKFKSRYQKHLDKNKQ